MISESVEPRTEIIMGNRRSSNGFQRNDSDMQSNYRKLQFNHERLKGKADAIQRRMQSIQDTMKENQEMLERKIDTTLHVIEVIVEDKFTKLLSGMKQNGKTKPKIVEKPVEKPVAVKETQHRPTFPTHKRIRKSSQISVRSKHSPIVIKSSFDRGSLRQYQIESQLNLHQDKNPGLRRTGSTASAMPTTAPESATTFSGTTHAGNVSRKSTKPSRHSVPSRKSNYAQMLSRAGAAAAKDPRRSARETRHSGSSSRLSTR